jgi:hypothetical protein
MKEISTIHQNPISHRWTRPARKISNPSLFGFLLLLLVANIQCKKSAPPPNILPPVTQEGKNTFGCKVNGEVWTPYSTCNVFYGRRCKELGFEVRQSDSLHKLPISFNLGTASDTDSSSFLMYTPATNITQTGNVIDSVVLLFFKSGSQFYHYPPSYTSGAVNVTKLDTVNHIMSGTFSFTLYNSNGDSAVVTDGRFDLTFNACLCPL